jgi:hypothetical protein
MLMIGAMQLLTLEDLSKKRQKKERETKKQTKAK